MCGICGTIYRDRQRPADRALVEAMSRCIRHRGPDEEGVHIRGNCGLGHQRLSIIDLATGQQPMCNEDGTCWIVFNGEIYNHHELREGLLARGHEFKTQSDTETIIHLYEEEGERCVEKLRGMFAFAIWNEREQELLLARDRAGKKPLFYRATDDGIAFASEIKSLLLDPSVERRVDDQALIDYLALQYVPAPRTIYEGIAKLPPAHTLRWRAGKAELRRYWKLDYEPKLSVTEEDAFERIRGELDEAVRIRLESEVPLGCLLSGGIDSSAVVAYMRRHVTGTLRTFSIGFEEASHNELPYARQIAEMFDTEHEEFIVKPDMVEALPLLAWHFDEPFADASALPTYYVAQITRRHVTVVLNGDGGDESFAGYARYLGVPRIEQYRRLPRMLRGGVIDPLMELGVRVAPNSSLVDRAKFLNDISLMTPARRYTQYTSVFRASQRQRLLGDRLRGLDRVLDPAAAGEAAFNDARLRAEIDRKMASDIASYLPGDLLVKMDRMCMAHHLEGRSPFLDHKLMELAASLPAEIKLGDGVLKRALKKALEPVLPHEILYRKKQGFGVPLADWFRRDLGPMLREILLSRQARDRGYFQPAAIERLIDEHQREVQNHYHRLWSLLCLEVWHRTFMDRDDPGGGPIRL